MRGAGAGSLEAIEGMRGRTQRAQRLRRSRRRNTRLFKNALNQCLCGLQGINGWEGAWGLVVWFLVCFGFGGWIREKGAESAKARQKSQKE